MSDKLMALLGLKGEITATFKPSYEFSHVASYYERVPHSVVFMNETGEYLKVPVDKFEMGDYEEWKDTEVLRPSEVLRAAGALLLARR